MARGDFQGRADDDDERARMERILAQCGVRLDGTLALPGQPEEWHLWPCNVRVWSLWCRLQTQWLRAGMTGIATGLDYSAVWATLTGLSVRKRREVFAQIQAMERAALEVMHAQEEARGRG